MINQRLTPRVEVTLTTPQGESEMRSWPEKWIALAMRVAGEKVQQGNTVTIKMSDSETRGQFKI